MEEVLGLRALDGGRAMHIVLQGSWNAMIDDQPQDQADRLVIDGEEAHWNGQPVPISFDGERASVDLGGYRYEIRRDFINPSRIDRFDVRLVIAPGEEILGHMERVGRRTPA